LPHRGMLRLASPSKTNRAMTFAAVYQLTPL
jgi:hypothetical protein